MRMSRQHAAPVTASTPPAGPARAVLAFVALLAVASPAGALWREFARRSDRTDDPVILEALVDADLDERLEILEGLGERPDPFLGAYLDDFLLRHTGSPAESEHLLRVLLESAYPPAAAPEELAPRVEPNRDALLAAASRLATFSDPQLRAAIVRLIPLLPGGRADLLALVDGLVDLLEHGDGLLDPRDDGLLLDALDAMGRTGSPDFLEPALAVARLSHEKAVVDRARAVARTLAGVATGR